MNYSIAHPYDKREKLPFPSPRWADYGGQHLRKLGPLFVLLSHI